MEFEFVDQFALMPTGRDMLLAGSGLGTAGDPSLMEFLKGQSGGADLETGLVEFVLFGPDAISPAGAVSLLQERSGCGCSGKAEGSSYEAEFQITETPGDELDPALDLQSGYVDLGNGTGYDDANGNGQWDQGETIFINWQTEDRVTPWELWGTGGGSGSGGDGGGGGGGGSATAVAAHAEDCGSDDGAAVQVADHVMGTLSPGVEGPPNALQTSTGRDWTEVEFGAVIVNNGNGTFGALNDTIYSNDATGYAFLPQGNGASIAGIWHNHPVRSGAFQQLVDTFPSARDWQALAGIAQQPGAASNLSLWITGPDEITREFKLSERSQLDKDLGLMTQEELKALQKDRERSRSCV